MQVPNAEEELADRLIGTVKCSAFLSRDSNHAQVRVMSGIHPGGKIKVWRARQGSSSRLKLGGSEGPID